MTKLWVLIMELNLTMLLRMMLKSFDITLARVMSMDLMLTRFLKMYSPNYDKRQGTVDLRSSEEFKQYRQINTIDKDVV